MILTSSLYRAFLKGKDYEATDKHTGILADP